jgi:ribonuclease HI
VVIYTDGSGTSDGGAGVVVTCGDPADPQITQTIAVKGAPRTSSYEEEVCAMNTALEYIRANCQEDQVTICTDSLSLCQALTSLNEEVDSTLWRISQCLSTITVQWVPAHCGVPGNEAADQAAKDATSLEDASRPVSYASECARIRQAVQDPTPTDPKDIMIADIYASYSRARDEAEITTRKDQIDIARLRARTHPALQAYQKKLDASADATCPRCGTGEEDLEHWLIDCTAMSSRRMKMFGNSVLGSDILTLMPGKSLELAGASILRTPGSPSSESC